MRLQIILRSLFFLALGLLFTQAYGQGCVAIRQFSTGNGGMSNGSILSTGEWQVGTNYRYFKSFRHFMGTEEQPDRLEEHTEVINHQHSLDLFATYAFSPRWFTTLTVPFVYNERSSLYEHGRTERHTTYSSGLSDMRLGVAYWLFDPQKHQGGNLSVGLGIKAPTGDYAATSTFYNVGEDGGEEVRTVDQSIQPGDGGWGLFLDIQAFQQVSHSFILYANLNYLSNPREMNGTSTNRSRENESIMSVADQFGGRLGVSYITPLQGLGASLGGRIEGIPVYDLIGGSEGFRRPGYVISVEPGLTYGIGRAAINLNVPIAVVRNRTQSVPDKETEAETGRPRHGDAAFADYLINVGVTFRLGRDRSMPMEHDIPVIQDVRK